MCLSHSEVLQYIKCDGKNEILTKIYHKVQYISFIPATFHVMLYCTVISEISNTLGECMYYKYSMYSNVVDVSWNFFRITVHI